MAPVEMSIAKAVEHGPYCQKLQSNVSRDQLIALARRGHAFRADFLN